MHIQGLILAEEMKSSVKSMDNLLEYAKDLFCKGDPSLEKYWPSNWRETEKLLKVYCSYLLYFFLIRNNLGGRRINSN